MRVATLSIVIAGPLFGLIGYSMSYQWLFWIGVAICGFDLFMDTASGRLRAPVLPAVIIVISLILRSPWYIGIGVGIVLWGTLSAISELYGTIREWIATRRHGP